MASASSLRPNAEFPLLGILPPKSLLLLQAISQVSYSLPTIFSQDTLPFWQIVVGKNGQLMFCSSTSQELSDVPMLILDGAGHRGLSLPFGMFFDARTVIQEDSHRLQMVIVSCCLQSRIAIGVNRVHRGTEFQESLHNIMMAVLNSQDKWRAEFTVAINFCPPLLPVRFPCFAARPSDCSPVTRTSSSGPYCNKRRTEYSFPVSAASDSAVIPARSGFAWIFALFHKRTGCSPSAASTKGVPCSCIEISKPTPFFISGHTISSFPLAATRRRAEKHQLLVTAVAPVASPSPSKKNFVLRGSHF
ncbi:hypothetical protein BGZ57DRAFT_856122 [Hyaloscypha finlandica]|nr:hypothetical protein BGZ57DRAFT_856122 [Hyaloscypha finlandica]